MMRFDTFGRTVLFGAVTAVGWLPWVMVAGPAIGTPTARAIYLIVATGAYIAGLSPSSPYRAILAVAAMMAAALFAMFAETTMSLVVILAVILGVARSGFIHASPAPNAVVREMILLGGGLLLARFVAGAAVMPTSGALWAFFLVQGLFFLMPGYRPDAAVSRLDPFDAAYRRALSLLDERGV